jgi:hypothetical protein
MAIFDGGPAETGPNPHRGPNHGDECPNALETVVTIGEPLTGEALEVERVLFPEVEHGELPMPSTANH